MSTITVKQYVMLLTSQSIVCAASSHTPGEISNPYKYCSPIMRIVCADGEELSVQAHGGCHVKFADVPQDWLYSPTFGRELSMCETDCEELDQYGIDDINDIEAYVAKHGGIDIEATTSKAVEAAIKAIEPYKRESLIEERSWAISFRYMAIRRIAIEAHNKKVPNLLIFKFFKEYDIQPNERVWFWMEYYDYNNYK